MLTDDAQLRDALLSHFKIKSITQDDCNLISIQVYQQTGRYVSVGSVAFFFKLQSTLSRLHPFVQESFIIFLKLHEAIKV